MNVNKKFPLIDAFDKPFNNDATLNERYKNNPLAKKMAIEDGEYDGLVIRSHSEAASYLFKPMAKSYRIANHIEDQLSEKLDRSAMPSKTPKSIKDYQQRYPDYSPNDVDTAINDINCTLSEGQVLYHGGFWSNPQLEEMVTDRPFSTSFCPEVALSNAFHNDKAYKSGEIHLFVLRAKQPKTNVFVYKQTGNVKMKHEKEVLFASGATLSLKNAVCVNERYTVPCVNSSYGKETKTVPVYVLEIEIS